MGTGQLATLIFQGFSGKIYPIHPKESTVLGFKAYRSIFDLPEIPDLAFMVLPTDIVVPKLEECGRAGVQAAVVVSGGFREVGEAGLERERMLVRVAEKFGMVVIGPNCIGVSNFHIGMNTTYFPYQQDPGEITIISQSGTYSCHVYGYTRKFGMRLSHTVSVGNSAVVDLIDCLEYFSREPHTKAIALYIEGLRDGKRFLRVAREISQKKPVVALFVGGTQAGAKAGMSHTGALGGDDQIYEGVFRQAGLIRVRTVEEMLDTAWALASLPPPAGNRICVLTNAGGPGASMADSCNREGLEVPEFSAELKADLKEILPHTASVSNPVDLTYFMDLRAMYERIPRIILGSDEVDGIVMYGVFGSLLYRTLEEGLGGRIKYPIDEVIPLVRELLGKFVCFPREYGKPLIVSSFWGTDDDALKQIADNGIPVYSSPERGVAAMAALYRYGRYLRGFTED